MGEESSKPRMGVQRCRWSALRTSSLCLFSMALLQCLVCAFVFTPILLLKCPLFYCQIPILFSKFSSRVTSLGDTLEQPCAVLHATADCLLQDHCPQSPRPAFPVAGQEIGGWGSQGVCSLPLLPWPWLLWLWLHWVGLLWFQPQAGTLASEL